MNILGILPNDSFDEDIPICKKEKSFHILFSIFTAFSSFIIFKLKFNFLH